MNGFTPFCNSAVSTGRFPQISGMKAQFHCNGTTPVLDGIWKTPSGVMGPLTLIGDRVTPSAIVTLDYMNTAVRGIPCWRRDGCPLCWRTIFLSCLSIM